MLLVFLSRRKVARNQKHKVAQEGGLNIERRRLETNMSERTSAPSGARANRFFRGNGPECESAEFQAEVRVDSKRTRIKGSF